MDNTYTNATQDRMYNSDMSLVLGNSAMGGHEDADLLKK